MSEEEYKAKHVAPTALKRLQGELILHKLMELEKIEVKDNELKEEIKTILSKFQNQEVLERLKKLYIP
jgi:FKBP-type peptidyl-prolyl cis-trans isomerase (trigger factor)